jgi:ABC-type hemin transport system ATPase subunit
MTHGKLLTGNAAAAWGARLADVDYIPAFPITPQTEIIEPLARWAAEGTIPARFVTLDSEHSMLTAAGAAAAAGARVFTATSIQGLLYGFEMLYAIAGWRVPMVLVNVSRGLSSPITLEADHNDILAARDSGFLQIHTETCQEVVDTILMAYRLAEDRRVMLPVLVNLDGFTLSFTREPVVLPQPIPSLTARENVVLVTDIARAPMPPEEALALVGLAARLDHFPAQLSGGEQQRVAIARAVAKRPEVLLCDEPTGALDFQTGELVLEVIERINRALGTTTAVITHNAGMAAMADRVITLRSGQILHVQRHTTKVAPEKLEW